jgi:hypothetical protein
METKIEQNRTNAQFTQKNKITINSTNLNESTYKITENLCDKELMPMIETLLKRNDLDFGDEFTLEINCRGKASTNANANANANIVDKLIITNTRENPPQEPATTIDYRELDVYSEEVYDAHCADCEEYSILDEACSKSIGIGGHDFKLINEHTDIESYQCSRCFRMGTCSNILREIKRQLKISALENLSKHT